jgi:hypothetical protein
MGWLRYFSTRTLSLLCGYLWEIFMTRMLTYVCATPIRVRSNGGILSLPRKEKDPNEKSWWEEQRNNKEGLGLEKKAGPTRCIAWPSSMATSSSFTGASYPSRSYQVSRCPIESDVVTAFNGLEGILLWDSISCRQHQHAEGLLRGRMLEFEITGSVCSIPLL